MVGSISRAGRKAREIQPDDSAAGSRSFGDCQRAAQFRIPSPQVTLKEVIISGRSSAGYFCDLIYEEFDERKMSLEEIKGERVDQFRASFEADGKGPFGIHLTFYEGIPVGSEGYSYDVGLPDNLRNPKLIGDVVIDPY